MIFAHHDFYRLCMWAAQIINMGNLKNIFNIKNLKLFMELV